MKISSILSVAIVVVILSITACKNQKRQDKLVNEIDSVSYALGLDIANKIKINFKEANHAIFLEAYEDAADSSKVKIKADQIGGILNTFFMRMQQEAMAEATDSTFVKEVKINSNKTTALLSEADSVSYALGLDMANNLKSNFEDVNNRLFVQGYNELTDSLKVLLEMKDLEGIIRNFVIKKQNEMQELQKVAGIKFLEENKTKEGVLTTDSGLQYIILKEGSDKRPSATDHVTVHYHGTTPEGVVFDSSVDRGKPSSFGLNQVIKGWTEGLQLMGEGAKFKFFIPQELAYGANPRGGVIKPFMPLVFEVELIKIN